MDGQIFSETVRSSNSMSASGICRLRVHVPSCWSKHKSLCLNALALYVLLNVAAHGLQGPHLTTKSLDIPGTITVPAYHLVEPIDEITRLDTSRVILLTRIGKIGPRNSPEWTKTQFPEQVA